MAYRPIPLDPKTAREAARANGIRPVSAYALAKRLAALPQDVEVRLLWRQLPSGDMGCVASFIVPAKSLHDGEDSRKGLDA